MHTEQSPPSLVATIPEGVVEPRIYVACLAAYNNGSLYGCWVEATNPDEIRSAVRAMLAASPEPNSEEWAIHDYEGFAGAELSEWASVEQVCRIAGIVGEYGALGAKVLAHFDNEFDAARTAFEDYAGEHQSLGDFAAELFEHTYEAIPDPLKYYIDWQSLGRDMELSDDIFTIETGFQQVHVFWTR